MPSEHPFVESPSARGGPCQKDGRSRKGSEFPRTVLHPLNDLRGLEFVDSGPRGSQDLVLDFACGPKTGQRFCVFLRCDVWGVVGGV